MHDPNLVSITTSAFFKFIKRTKASSREKPLSLPLSQANARSMAPHFLRDIKGLSFSCSSPVSSAICSSIDCKSIARPSNAYPRDKTSIDHHNPSLRGSKRSNVINHLSQSPSKPKSYTHKSSKSSTDKKPSELNPISPPCSSRYLLDETAFFDASPDHEPGTSLSLVESPKPKPPREIQRQPSSSSIQPIQSPCLQPLKRDASVVIRSPGIHTPKRDESAVFSPQIQSPWLQPLKREESAVIRSPLRIESPRIHTPKRDGYMQSPWLQHLKKDESPVCSPHVLSPWLQPLKREEPPVLMPSSSARGHDQVVVLRVSLKPTSLVDKSPVAGAPKPQVTSKQKEAQSVNKKCHKEMHNS